MRRILALLLGLLLLAACGGKSSDPGYDALVNPGPTADPARIAAELEAEENAERTRLQAAKAGTEKAFGEAWNAEVVDGVLSVTGEISGAGKLASDAASNNKDAISEWETTCASIDTCGNAIQTYLDQNAASCPVLLTLISDIDHKTTLYAASREGVLVDYAKEHRRQAGEQGVAIDFVYVAASGAGSRYHSAAGCPGLNGVETDQLTKSAAREAGYTPCGICYPLGDPE